MENPGSVQGQPAPGPEVAGPTPTATPTPDSFAQPAHPEFYQPGTKAEFDAAAQAYQVGVMGQGGEGAAATDRADNFNRAYEKFFGPLSPEDKELLARAARDYVKRSIGVTDTADLNPQARKTFEAVWDWMTSKIRR